MELFKLLGTIAIDVSGAIQDIEKTETKASKLASTFKSVGSKVSDIGVKMSKTVTAGATAAGAAIAVFANNAAKTTDNIDKMSQKIGISRQAYQELDFICSQSGTSVDTLQMGLKTLTNQMQSAADGGKTATAAFEKLGVSIYDSSGQLKDQETMMWEAMSALQGMENQTEKAALATDLFGRSGSELMPLLNGASGSIEEMKEQAHELGLVISDEAVDAGVKYSDTVDQMKRSFSAAATSCGAALLPILTRLSQWVIDKGVPAFQNFMGKVSEIIEWFNGLSEGTQKIITVLAALVVGIGPVLAIAGKVISTVGTIINVGKTLITVLTGFNPVMLAVVAAVAAVIAIGVTLYKNWDKIKAKASELFSGIKSVWDDIKSITENVFGHVFDVISSKIQAAKNAVETAISGIKKAVSSVGDFFSGGSSEANTITTTSRTTSLAKHAEGGILTKPTIFGYTPSSGTYHIGGEAGAEAVAPIDKLQGYVAAAVAEQNAPMLEVLKAILQANNNIISAIMDKDTKVYLNSKEISKAVNKDLGVVF